MLETVIAWIDQNKDWFFEGLGVAVLSGIAWAMWTLFFKGTGNPTQTINSGNNSTNIQVGQDLKIREKEKSNDV